ncbi:BamA/TamA family outer membrane protein [Roseivirga sp.]|uniref:BamA/TamA family outer membrane protein n=1 Tax=Roseivirga sp. TaxID=1964215 RepID=UPI003B5164CA
MSRLVLLVLCGLSFGLDSLCQDYPDIDPETDVTIGKIYITGNKRTLRSIILRELNFEEGQTLKMKDLATTIELDQQKLINTRLFVTAEIVPLFLSSNNAEILIRVQERWYIFPVPIFKLADRNFTEWWVNQNRDFSRVNYGLQLYHLNFSGRNDKLVLRTQFGFTKQYSFQYSIPYINKEQTAGLTLSTSFATNKTVSYSSDGHRLQFVESDNTIRRLFSSSGALTFRPSFYNRHTFSLGYNRATIADDVLILNDQYFGQGSTLQEYFAFAYSFVHDKRDYVAYPLTGTRFSGSISQLGLGIFDDIDMFSARIDYSTYTQLGEKLFWANSVDIYKNFASDIPYLVRSGFGYNPDFIRGYERYVVESDFLGAYRTSMRYQILKGVKELNPRSMIDQFRTLPYAFYIKLFMDAGYAGDPLAVNSNNFFNNKWIGSVGAGLDIVTYYDFVIRFEYSVNREGNTGFFVNFRSAL